MTHERERALRADLWRAGLLAPGEAQRFEQDMASDPRLAEQARFGARAAQALADLPRLAARRAVRSAPRRVRWGRLAAAAALTASMAGLAAIGIGLSPLLQPTQAPQVNAQTADAVQNMEFYEWLATHPKTVESTGDRDEG